MIRVEDKYIIRQIDLYSLINRLENVMEYDKASGANGSYLISSMYFDDLWDTHFYDTISGNPLRKKFRIRIYNNDFSTIKLEVKNKIYSRINKQSTQITYKEMEKLILGETIRDLNVSDDVIAEFNQQIIYNKLMPKVIVTYERRAFVSEAGNVRITFDTNIRGSTDIDKFADKELVHDDIGISAVLEVKYDEFVPDYILQLLETNRMQQTSCSKYRMCRELYE